MFDSLFLRNILKVCSVRIHDRLQVAGLTIMMRRILFSLDQVSLEALRLIYFGNFDCRSMPVVLIPVQVVLFLDSL